jgi:predicted HTH transcriptional regulator
MTWDEIIQLLNQGEGQSVEFDKVIPSSDDIAREYVAFSNSDGGRIIYGIDDKNKHLMGADLDDTTTDKLIKIGKDKCVPSITPNIEVIEISGKRIVAVTIN